MAKNEENDVMKESNVKNEEAGEEESVWNVARNGLLSTLFD